MSGEDRYFLKLCKTIKGVLITIYKKVADFFYLETYNYYWVFNLNFIINIEFYGGHLRVTKRRGTTFFKSSTQMSISE